MTNLPLPRRTTLAGLGLGSAAAFLASAAAHGAEADRAQRRARDHERARQALERGEALPLAEILSRLRPELGGEVVGVEFEREDGRWIYEFKVIEPHGRLVELEVDAATARVLRRKPE